MLSVTHAILGECNRNCPVTSSKWSIRTFADLAECRKVRKKPSPPISCRSNRYRKPILVLGNALSKIPQRMITLHSRCAYLTGKSKNIISNRAVAAVHQNVAMLVCFCLDRRTVDDVTLLLLPFGCSVCFRNVRVCDLSPSTWASFPRECALMRWRCPLCNPARQLDDDDDDDPAAVRTVTARLASHSSCENKVRRRASGWRRSSVCAEAHKQQPQHHHIGTYGWYNRLPGGVL